MYEFDYQRPASVDAAVKIGGGDARFLAGGQSLVQSMRLRLASAPTLVDLGGIPDLRFIKVDGNTVSIGAMTTHATVARSAEVIAAIPALAELAGGIGVGDRAADGATRWCATSAPSAARSPTPIRPPAIHRRCWR